jgi:hypothetical protein
MTIASSGAMRTSAIRTEYGGGTPMRLTSYRRGHASGWVKANAGNNVADNNSATVPASGPMRMGNFRGQGKGWTYNNMTVRVPSPAHYHCHVEFGDDWANSTWPCFYNNYATMGSNSLSYYALVIYGRANGPFTFTNNSNIEGAGGVTTGQAGQHAVYIYNTVAGANRPIVINAGGGQIRGGGGAGGTGGTGGTGGSGSVYTDQPGPTLNDYTYSRNVYTYKVDSGSGYTIIWAGATVYGPRGGNPGNPTGLIGGWWYYIGSLAETYAEAPYNVNGYTVRRSMNTLFSPGGPGGAGGAGGRGVGYGQSNLPGSTGAAGGAGNSYCGSGGQGGTGGTGGTFGNAGATGNTGLTGNAGSQMQTGQAGPTVGAAGAAGGAAGNAVYAATPWGWTNNGTISGVINAGVAPT